MENKKLSKEILERLSEYYTEIYQDSDVIILDSKFDIEKTNNKIRRKLRLIKYMSKKRVRIIGDLLIIFGKEVDEITLDFLYDILDLVKKDLCKKEVVIKYESIYNLLLDQIIKYFNIDLINSMESSMITVNDKIISIKLAYEDKSYERNLFELLEHIKMSNLLGDNIGILTDAENNDITINLDLSYKSIKNTLDMVEELLYHLKIINQLINSKVIEKDNLNQKGKKKMETIINLAPRFYNMVEIEGITVLIQRYEFNATNTADSKFALKLIKNVYNTARRNNNNKIINNGEYLLIRNRVEDYSNVISINRNDFITRNEIMNDFITENIHWDFESVKTTEDNGVYTFRIFSEIKGNIPEEVTDDIRTVLNVNDELVKVVNNRKEVLITFDTNNVPLITAINKLEHILSLINYFYVDGFTTSELDYKYIQDLNLVAEELGVDYFKLSIRELCNEKNVYIECNNGNLYPIYRSAKYNNLFIASDDKIKK